jgi:hypothetical protein
MRALLATVALLLLAAAPAHAREWLAGDLHVHSTYSHDSYGGPTDDNTGIDEANTLGYPVAGNFALAATRGLDFLAITDHNDVRSQSDPGFGAFGVLGLPGYENSLHGHAQMLGATHVYSDGDSSTAAVGAAASELRRDGGVFQINHPASDSVAFPDDIDWGYGYDVVPDTVEVWNIGPWAWQPPLPSANSNDDSLRWWEGWLNRGFHVGATGGSDSHWIATSGASGPGQPTTWVLAAQRTRTAILAALRAGRTTVSGEPPNLGGARAYLEAMTRVGRHKRTFTVGDTVRRRSTFRARVDGAPGAILRVVSGGEKRTVTETPVTSPAFRHEFRVPRGTRWVYAIVLDRDAPDVRAQACDGAFGSQTTLCRNALSVRALTSAVYVRE